ncbi:MAG: primosomal protein N' family DNA-binding protein [Acidimicrobiales bacterium]
MSAVRAVRIITEVGAIDRPFDYALTESTQHCGVGDRVRVNFNNRSVRGWVLGDVEANRELKPVVKWLGYGPPPALLGLLEWASWRWFSPLSRFLVSSSPHRLITALPERPAAKELARGVAGTALHVSPGVLQCAPTADPLPLILGAYEATRDRGGSLVVLVPTEAWANRLRGRLEQRGVQVASGDSEWDRMRAGWPVVVGARGTALAPVPRVAGAVIVDADDEAYRSEASPTWDAFTMLDERCRREDAPLWATTMIPSPRLIAQRPYEKVGDIARGWPRVQVIDRRTTDPRDGVLSRGALDAAHRALGGDETVAVAVILQRLGAGRLFACRACGELARCAQCGQGEQDVDGQLSCRDGHESRANFCRSCGATNLKAVRVGVSTLARDVAAQLGQPVSEVTASSDPSMPLARVVVGTEAVWQRVRRCGVVIFVDFDQYLLAPRESARRAALSAVGKAGRLVGARSEGRGVVVVQTRRGDDLVLRDLERGEFDDIVREDIETARLLALAPFGASASISGDAAPEFVTLLKGVGDEVTVYGTDKGFEVRANDVGSLIGALRSIERPVGRLRVAVE